MPPSDDGVGAGKQKGKKKGGGGASAPDASPYAYDGGHLAFNYCTVAPLHAHTRTHAHSSPHPFMLGKHKAVPGP
jgi:hypothetical protein